MRNEGPTGTGLPRDALEAYAADLFEGDDALLRELRSEIEARGFPTIQVPERTGRTLHVLVRAAGARRVLEIGTLGGYSAIWMGRALPEDGRLTTLEIDADRVELAREYVERAGLEKVVEVRHGDAREMLPSVGPDASFDVVFLDADKEGYVHYLSHARRLLRPGGLLMADNAFWKGKVLQDPDEADEVTRAVQAFNEELARSPDFEATILPVGDGVAVGVRA